MRVWKIDRIPTWSDDDLAKFLNKIETKPGCKVREVMRLGENPAGVPLYQVLYTEEDL